MSLDSAIRHLAQAQANLAAASERVDAAEHAVDTELAKLGWMPFQVIVSPGVEMYRHPLHGDAVVERSQLLRELDRQASTA